MESLSGADLVFETASPKRARLRSGVSTPCLAHFPRPPNGGAKLKLSLVQAKAAYQLHFLGRIWKSLFIVPGAGLSRSGPSTVQDSTVIVALPVGTLPRRGNQDGAWRRHGLDANFAWGRDMVKIEEGGRREAAAEDGDLKVPSPF